MVGELVCMYVCTCTVSEWECEWVMRVWCVWVRDVRVSEVSEVKWSEVKWSEVKWSEVKWSEVKWSEVSERGSEGARERGSEGARERASEWVSEWVRQWVSRSVSQWVSEWVSESVSQSLRLSQSVSQSVSEWGRTSNPFGRLSYACHAKEAETQGRQRNPGAYIRPLGSAHCPTPATQKRRRPRDASGTPGRTSDPLTVHIVPRLPRKSGGDPGTLAEPRASTEQTRYTEGMREERREETGDRRAERRQERAGRRAERWGERRECTRKQSYDEISLRVLSDQLVLDLHGHKSHPLGCHPRSQIQGLMKSEPPLKGTSDDKKEAM